MTSDKYPVFELKPPLIIFWILEKLALPIFPSLGRLLYLTKYSYHKIPRTFVINLFDNYAEEFEKHLIGTLEYNTPTTLTEFIYSESQLAKPINNVLDLGCGTGLLGAALTQQFKIERLIGVDLSWGMLKKSKAKSIYKELHNADILEYLRNSNYCFDLIASSDVLIYVGELKAVMLEVHKRLRHGGYFAFSVESQASGTFKITNARRFQHSLNYLQSLSAELGFKSIKSSAVDLRKEQGVMVPGYLILMQK